MSRLMDIVANTLGLVLVDKIEIVKKRTSGYSICTKQQELLGELVNHSGYCYFWQYNDYPECDEALLSVTLLVTIREFLAANYHLVKLSELKAKDRDIYLITEK